MQGFFFFGSRFFRLIGLGLFFGFVDLGFFFLMRQKSFRKKLPKASERLISFRNPSWSLVYENLCTSMHAGTQDEVRLEEKE